MTKRKLQFDKQGEVIVPFRRKLWRILMPMLIYDGALWLATLAAASILPTIFTTEDPTELLYRMSVPTTLVAGIPALWILWKEYQKDLELFEPEKPLRPELLLLAILGTMSFGHLFNGLLVISGFTTMFGSYSTLAAEIYEGQNPLLLILTVGIVSSACEEVAFRGLIYRRARDFWGVPAAVLVSALLFGIYHGTMVQFVYAAVLSVVLILFYEMSGNLMVPFLAHAAENIWGLYRSSLMEWLGEKAPMAETGIWILEAVIVVAAGIVVIRRYRKH